MKPVTNRQLLAVTRGCWSVGPLYSDIYGDIWYINEQIHLESRIRRLLVALIFKYPACISFEDIDIDYTIMLKRVWILRKVLPKGFTIHNVPKGNYRLVYNG